MVYRRAREGQASAEELELTRQWRQERIQAILARPLEELFYIQNVQPVIPEYAPIHNSVTCSGCGERVMETRVRLVRGELYCIPCFQARERRL